MLIETLAELFDNVIDRLCQYKDILRTLLKYKQKILAIEGWFKTVVIIALCNMKQENRIKDFILHGKAPDVEIITRAEEKIPVKLALSHNLRGDKHLKTTLSYLILSEGSDIPRLYKYFSPYYGQNLTILNEAVVDNWFLTMLIHWKAGSLLIGYLVDEEKCLL